MSEIVTERIGSEKQIIKITLNRPEMRNAFNTKMAESMRNVFRTIAKDSTIRVVLLTTSSPVAFCSGADLKERKGMTEEDWQEQHKLFEDMFYALEDIPQPTIALVQGYALAGGFELALICDLLVASHTAKFGLTEVARGIMPGGGGARILPNRVSLHKAKEWLFTGEIFDAKEANDAGLLNALLKEDELLDYGIKLAELIALNAPLGVQGTKKVTQQALTLEQEAARAYEIDVYNKVILSEDRQEGILAFNEKRPPIFKGK